jgi:hypothetical protein
VVDLAQEMQTEPSKTARLGFITGLVPKLKVTSFERILFRATRGNMFLKQAPIEQPVDDPATGEKVLYFPLSVYEEMEIIWNIILLCTGGVFTLFSWVGSFVSILPVLCYVFGFSSGLVFLFQYLSFW